MSTLREQYMERLIRGIFLRKGSGFVLKGGGALRALYGEQRLTKDIDLDFTNPKRTADSLHNTISKSIADAALGLPIRDLKVSKPGKAEKTPRWKINFSDPDGQHYHVEVEVCRDPKRATPGNVVQQPFAPQAAHGIARFWVDIYDGPALIASKLAALLGRGLPRDIYDLDTLIGASPPPDTEQIRWALDRASLHDERPVNVLRTRLKALTWNRYRTELQDSLMDHIADRIDQSEWTAMKRRVGDYAEPLLLYVSG
jgi:predicted nucleotidyltransferase component of viral defense system